MKRFLGVNVVETALERLRVHYEGGDRVVCSFSAGKDSGICLDLCVEAARRAGRLPVEVVFRDDEAMFPGTHEYALRVAQRPEVDFCWLIQNQPIVNIFNRVDPYWWVYDWLLEPSDWMQLPPDFATYDRKHLGLTMISGHHRHPPPPGKRLINVVGLRAAESTNRMRGIFSQYGYLNLGPWKDSKAFNAYVIYDWTEGDVWRAVKEFGWDYNRAYDVMCKSNWPRNLHRIAPPTMLEVAVHSLPLAMQAWPSWFDKLQERCPGVRTAARYGLSAIHPIKHPSETWEQCFWRECVDDAPAQFIRERAERAHDIVMKAHAAHSTQPFPQVSPCKKCYSKVNSWKKLAISLYAGDPFGYNLPQLGHIQPEYFRPGAGTWTGLPSW